MVKFISLFFLNNINIVMQLRERQKVFVNKCTEALLKSRNTLGVAPTGSGKTIMLSYIMRYFLQNELVKKILVIVHRNELLYQNRDKFLKIDNSFTTSVLNATEKDTSGQITFCTIQTLNVQLKKEHFKNEKFDFIIIDEAHHIVAKSYLMALSTLQKRKKFYLMGVTATAERSDQISIGQVFSNVADIITLSEMIKNGYLVPSRTYIIDIGKKKELYNAKKSNQNDFNMKEIELIMNDSSTNNFVVDCWIKKASERKTVVFCSTVVHAENMLIAFNSKNVLATMIHGGMSKKIRENNLDIFQNGSCNVMINVAILTEGFDYQPVSCIVLLRPSSFKSTVIQMVGRGLRVVDKKIYPNIVKNDCIVLDFGISTLMHGYLNGDLNKSKNYEQQINDIISDEIINNKVDNTQNEDSNGSFARPIDKDDSGCNYNKFLYKFNDDCIVYSFTNYHQKRSLFLISLDDVIWYVIDNFTNKKLSCIMSSQSLDAAYKYAVNVVINSIDDEYINLLNEMMRTNATHNQLKYIPNSFMHSKLNKFTASCLLSFIFEKSKILKIIKDKIVSLKSNEKNILE